MKDVDSRVISLVIRDEALRTDEFTKEENMEEKDLWEQRNLGEEEESEALVKLEKNETESKEKKE